MHKKSCALLQSNPACAIPVVLRRLKEKVLEWRKIQHELNKQNFEEIGQVFPNPEKIFRDLVLFQIRYHLKYLIFFD
jgi:hypothetical protein